MRPASRVWAIAAAAAAGAAITAVVFHPGVMSPDSVDSYRQAVTGAITGRSRPPAMPFLWRQVLAVWPGVPTPLAPLLLQLAVFWTGLALVVHACRVRMSRAVALILFAGGWPPVFALLGALWTDVLMGAFLLLAVGIGLAADRRRSRLLAVAALAPLAVAVALRENAVAAVPPLGAWLAWIWRCASGRAVLRPWTLAAVAFGIAAALALAARGAGRVVITAPSGSSSLRAIQFTLLHDLAGIAAATGELRFPAYVTAPRPEMTARAVGETYDPASVNEFVYSPRWGTREPMLTADPARARELVHAWLGAALAHPAAYLAHRGAVLASLFQIRGVYYPFHIGIAPNDLGLEFRPRPLYLTVVNGLYDTRAVFFRGWAHAALAAGVLVLGWRRRAWAAAAVSGSGLAYVLPYAAVSAGSDFRFIWWLVLAAIVGAVLAVAGPAPAGGRR